MENSPLNTRVYTDIFYSVHNGSAVNEDDFVNLAHVDERGPCTPHAKVIL